MLQRIVEIKRPVDKKWPISAEYGAKSKWWNWHLNAVGRWINSKGADGLGQHKGIDFATPIGTPVVAPVTGLVEAAWWESADEPKKGFGLRIRIRYSVDGKPWLFYLGHLSKILVKKGDIVREGDLIAYSGDTGHSSGPHLHIETRDPEMQQHPMTLKD